MLRVLRHVTSRICGLQSRPFTIPSAKHSIYISNSTNPYFNLTFEDWLFRHKASEEPLLLIYRNDPCVVIGRNQNPWKEVAFRTLREQPEVPFIRRRSGGGAVYHDLGNTNFSIHVPRPKFDRHKTAQIVLCAVRSLGIADVLILYQHISGSAYKVGNKRAYHHGTMLISTQLDKLMNILNPDKDTMMSKGTASVRSPTCNLQQFSAIVTHDSFTDAIVNEFRKEYNISTPVQVINETDELQSIEYIRKGMEELSSWEWAYGQSPEFIYELEGSFEWGRVRAEFKSRRGMVNQCTLKVENSVLSQSDKRAVIELGRLLEGQRYGFFQDTFFTQEEVGPRRDVLMWLDESV